MLLHVLALNVLEFNLILLRVLAVVHEMVKVGVSLLHFLPVHVVTACSLLLVRLDWLVGFLLEVVLAFVASLFLIVVRLPMFGRGIVFHLLERVVPPIVPVFVP